MRGKVSGAFQLIASKGITPAYAGKSQSNRAKAYYEWDHPRVCGEKFRAYVKIWNEWGLPPRMRGKAAAVDITSTLTRDHPRVCGEKEQKNKDSMLAQGSPPRMRGKD